MALVACMALVFLASGLALHLHEDGPKATCHVCQALHMPALAAESLPNVAAPELISWNIALTAQTSPADVVRQDHASRAPPAR